MLTRSLVFFIALGFASTALSQDKADRSSLLRFHDLTYYDVMYWKTYKEGKREFMVQYEVHTSTASVPATNPVGVPHYDAKVSVFEVLSGHLVKVGESFSTSWTNQQCGLEEDDPKAMVARALRESEPKQTDMIVIRRSKRPQKKTPPKHRHR